jgi:hypothetical protein
VADLGGGGHVEFVRVEAAPCDSSKDTRAEASLSLSASRLAGKSMSYDAPRWTRECHYA